MQKFYEINIQKLRHFYKFKNPTQMEISGSRKRICPGKKRMYVSPTLS
jgi:hypothetical protein